MTGGLPDDREQRPERCLGTGGVDPGREAWVPALGISGGLHDVHDRVGVRQELDLVESFVVRVRTDEQVDPEPHREGTVAERDGAVQM